MNYRKVYETSMSKTQQMLQGYLEAVAFTGAYIDEETADHLGLDYNENEPMLYDFNTYDIEESSINTAREHIDKFLSRAGDLLDGTNLPHGEPDWEDVGRNFWLSRNGQGAGFFDKTREFGDAADQLQEIAKEFGEATPYVKMNGDIAIE
jgi:hypothetical protein